MKRVSHVYKVAEGADTQCQECLQRILVPTAIYLHGMRSAL